jgi:hypothetical protein
MVRDCIDVIRTRITLRIDENRVSAETVVVTTLPGTRPQE